MAESPRPILRQKHAELYALVCDAYDLRRKLYSRASPGARKTMISSLRKEGPYRSAPAMAIEVRKAAEAEEKRNPLFDAAVDPYWPDALAGHAADVLQLDQDLVKALLRINEAEQAYLAQAARSLSPKVWFGFLLAAGAFFANQVPKELFKYLGLDYYRQYRSITFLVLAALLIYVAIVFGAIGPLMGRSNPRRVARDLETVRLVLVHLDAAVESDRG